MAITTTNLGTASCRIDYQAGDTAAGIVSALEAFITGKGWEVFDPYGTAGAGVGCYRALYVGGTSGTASHYKYVTIDTATAGYIFLRAYESWNSSTHVGTNKATDNWVGTSLATAAQNSQRLDTSNGGALYVFCSQRYLAILSSTPAGYGCSNDGGATGVFETARDNASDTLAGGSPAVVWSAMGHIGYSFNAVSVPRSFAGAVGDSNAQYGGLLLPEMGVRAAHGGNWGAVASINSVDGRPLASNLVVTLGSHTTSTVEVRGRIFGLFAMPQGAAAQFDTVSIPIDADGFYSAKSSTTVNCMVLRASSGVGLAPLAIAL